LTPILPDTYAAICLIFLNNINMLELNIRPECNWHHPGICGTQIA